MTALDVLVLSNGPGPSTDVTAQLQAAGHRVLRCHDPSAPSAWPCVALSGAPCPLTVGVDVALDVRAAVSSGTSPWEDGVACARRDDVPVVLAGRVAMHPFGDHVSEVVEGRDGVVDAVERAFDRARTAREAAVQAVCGAPVTLTRVADHLVVDVQTSLPPGPERAMVATRAAGAARSLAPTASHLTVTVSAPGAG